MTSSPARIKIGEVLRYPALKDPRIPVVDGYRNFRHLTFSDSLPGMQLERGINSPAVVRAHDGDRRPALLIRSSPWKAGTEQTPWHDVFDMDNGHVRYFGDHRIDTRSPTSSTSGNRALLDAWSLHQAPTEEARLFAPPLLLFRAVRRNNRPKGHVEFCGVGIVERVERVVQWADDETATFVNYVYDIVSLDLSNEDDHLDWRWIHARRQAGISRADTLTHAPISWQNGSVMVQRHCQESVGG